MRLNYIIRIFTVIIAIVLITVPQGCKKYEEGPWISFRRPLKRILGIWKVNSYKVNGVDKIKEYNDSCGCSLYFYHYSTNGNQKDLDNGTNELEIGDCIIRGRMFARFDLIDKKKTLYIDNLGHFSGFDSLNYITPLAPIDSTSQKVYWKINRLTEKELKIETDYKNNNYEVELYN